MPLPPTAERTHARMRVVSRRDTAAPDTGPGLGAWLLVGLAIGLDLTAAVSVVRWSTWRPHAAWLIPFDALVLMGGCALAFTLSVLALRAIGARPSAAALVSAAGVSVWATGIASSHARLGWSWLDGALLLSVALLLFVMRARNPSRVPFEVHCVVTAALVALGLLCIDSLPAATRATPALLGLALALRPAPPRPRAAGARFAMRLPAIAVLAACVLVPPPGSRPPRPPVATTANAGPSLVLIVLDTLRRDHVSLYGYARPTTPNLDAWAQRALVFDDASATSSWTLPSHASMFTGLYPRTHGAHGYRREGRENGAYPLGSETTTLAEIAAGAGIATGAIVSNHYFLGPEFGLDQGFDTYWLPRPTARFSFAPAEALAGRFAWERMRAHRIPYLTARHVSDAAIEWISARGDAPYFLFVNYMDVHRPNLRPTDESPIPFEDEARIPRHFPELTKVFEHEPLAEEIKRGLVNSYDRELIALDLELARLLHFLERDGRAERTAVIVTSDHGEFFGEHDLVDHMMHLHKEVVDVPFLVRAPGLAPGRSDKPVQSVDVFATALELLGLPDTRSQGVSALGDEAHPIVGEWYAAANGRLRAPRYEGRFERDLASLRDGTLRLFEYEDGVAELYDVATDPSETQDIAAARAEDVARLRAQLATWRVHHPDGTPSSGLRLDASLSGEKLDQLRQLGYAE